MLLLKILCGLMAILFLIMVYGLLSAVCRVSQKPITKFLVYERCRKSYVRYDEIPAALVKVVVTLEDVWFWKHCGIDFEQLWATIKMNFHARKILSGGSGITQQLAKNVYFSGVRSYKRKFVEAFVALYIERKLSKKEILELYLNIIYFGQNQFGVGNAVQYYFGKKVSDLDMNECISLATLLPSPYRYNPFSPTGLFPQMKEKMIKRLVSKKVITPEEGEIYATNSYKGVWHDHGHFTKEGLVCHAKSCFSLRTAYVWGGLGARLTDDLIEAKAEQFPKHFDKRRVKELKKLAKGVVYGFDCSGLLKCYLMGGIDNFKYNPECDMNSEKMIENAKEKGDIATLPDEEGICLYMPGHVGVYIGQGEVIEATNNKKFGDGVVRTRLSDRQWTCWFKLV